MSGVLRRAAKLLGCLNAMHPTLTLSQAVLRTGIPKTTAHRLLRGMSAEGWLVHANGEYRVGPRMFELGALSSLSWNLREVALPYMQDLFAATQQTIQLGVVVDGEVLYVEKVRSHRDVNALSRVGARMPLHCTSVGKTLLAFGDPAVIESVLQSRLLPRTNRTIVSHDELMQEISSIIKCGFAVDRQEAAPGMECVGAPILGPDGRAVAALSASVPIAGQRLDQLVPAVLTTARAISRRISAPW